MRVVLLSLERVMLLLSAALSHSPYRTPRVPPPSSAWGSRNIIRAQQPTSQLESLLESRRLLSAAVPDDGLLMGHLPSVQGVYVYSGSPHEQWSAILAASPVPPIRFAVVLHSGLRDFSRQLHQPDCRGGGGGGAGCIWEAGKRLQSRLNSDSPAAGLTRFLKVLGRLARAPVLRELMKDASLGDGSEELRRATVASEVLRGGATAGGASTMPKSGVGLSAQRKSAAASEEGRAAMEQSLLGGRASEELASLMGVVDCIREANGRMPLLLLPTALHSLRLSRLLRAHSQANASPSKSITSRFSSKFFSRATKRAKAHAALTDSIAAELLRLAVQYERSLAARATAILAPSAHEASLLHLLSRQAIVRILPTSIVLPHPALLPRLDAQLLAARSSFLVVADDVGEAREGLLWLVRDVWPLLRSAGTSPTPMLTLIGSGWRPVMRHGGNSDDAARVAGGWLGSLTQDLSSEILNLRRRGELTLIGEEATLAQTLGALDGACALLLPRLANESGRVAPSWGQLTPELVALWRGVPLVSTAAAVPELPNAVTAESCGITVHDDSQEFAWAAASLLAQAVWRRSSELARRCARTQLTTAQTDLGWTDILGPLLLHSTESHPN